MNSKKRSFLAYSLYFIIPLLIGLLVKYGWSNLNSDTETSYSQLVTDEKAPENLKLPEVVDYVFDVKPILSDRCYLCHGPDDGTREAGLRLDLKETAYAAIGENLDKFAIVPGDIEKSQLVHRITNPDLEKRMPPMDSNLSLSEYEKKILIKWIEQGAVWKDHWAFVKPEKPEVPEVGTSTWPENEIDNFILDKLDKKELLPSERARKEKLLRRVYFDLTGLPPSLEDLDAFIEDDDANAYEKVVDQLLASESYGERMASDWLDLARYADTHGYQDDLERIMWPWRDWVISAFNRNIPYDDFVTWQLAGDMIPEATKEQILASGFNRNHKITQEGGVIDEEYRVEYVMDRTVTTSKAFLGLTMECARCHSHKYDPISQEEFYSMYGFFNQVNEKGRIDYDELPKPSIVIDQEVVAQELPFVRLPDSIKEVQVMVMQDDPSLNRKTSILDRGTYDRPTTEVSVGTPEVILPFDEQYEKNRLGLSQWLFDEENPLTSRVAVNRLWQQMFGAGLVASTGDFGNQGSLPSHPELLDWLAVTFQEQNWDIKKILKLMAMSATYQQSSRMSPELLKKDPGNKWYAHSNRSKLTAEMIRDNYLFVSGLLVSKIGGPSVKPYQPDGLWAETTSGQGLTKYIPDTGENLHRRSLYTFWKRTVPPPSMMTFDAAARDDCTVKRQKTSTPLQALVLLNDPQLVEASQQMTTDLMKEEAVTEEEAVVRIFRKITCRNPNPEEIEQLLDFMEEAEGNFVEGDSSTESAQEYAYQLLINMVFNLDEAIVKG